jgi:NAD(P)-dependent dehydrogenase (short-subunit alcohol dehydrogenase family)
VVGRSQVVVVTGASSGIGRATALRFAGEGASLVLAARRAGALAEVVAECERAGGRAIAVPTDVTDEAAVDALAARAVEEFGRIDVWVNDAAVSVFAPLVEAPIEDVRRVLDVNVLGYVYGARAALREMLKQGRGVLVNVSSVVGEVPQPYAAPYSMSKAAVRALGGSLRSELALQKEKHVHVATVLPATIDTPFFSHPANYTGRRVLAMPPVYPPDAVAKVIVKAARRPKAEIAVGPISKAMVREHRRHPEVVEGQMALQVDTLHLSRTDDAPATTGNLYEPPADPADAAVTGGWHGAGRSRGRVVAAFGLVAVLSLLLARRTQAA